MTISFTPNSDDDLPLSRREALQRAWLKLMAPYPQGADCFEELFKSHIDGERRSCRYCGNHDLEKKYGGRYGWCNHCKKKTWFTSGTFFEGIRVPHAYLGAILLKENGWSFNASDLEALADVAYSTAWQIEKKITMVIDHDIKSEADALSVSSALFHDAICKRSIETPANGHPVAEQDEIERRQSDLGTADQMPKASAPTSAPPTGADPLISAPSGRELSEDEKKILSFLSVNPIHIDELFRLAEVPAGNLGSILCVLELEGVIERMPGELYVLYAASQHTPTNNRRRTEQMSGGADVSLEVAMTVGSIVDFVRREFHGVSRKYLQLFIAAHWCYVDRARWSAGALMAACSRFPAVKYSDIRAFVTPLMVNASPCS